MGYYPDSFGADDRHGKDFAIVSAYLIGQPRSYPSGEVYALTELAEVIGGFDDLYGKTSTDTLFHLSVNYEPSPQAAGILRASALFGLPKQTSTKGDKR
jgi:hypothetical protein